MRASFCLSAILLTLACGASAAPESKTQKDYLVSDLPYVSDDIHLHNFAGLINLDETTDANMFFWLWPRREQVAREKLIIFLNGGPGCSSVENIFLENGPIRINQTSSESSIYKNDASWNTYASVLYVDQPLGTGYSYTASNGLDRSLDQVAEHFMAFFDKFLDTFDSYKQADIYLVGRGFSGVFIPHFAQEMLKRNNAAKSQKYNLQGLMIGNGWFDPKVQYRALYDYSMEKGLLDEEDVQQRASQFVTKCEEDMEKRGVRIRNDACEQLLQLVLSHSVTSEDNIMQCISQFDIRQRDTYPLCALGGPEEAKDMTTILRNIRFMQSLHLPSQYTGWSLCNGHVSNALIDDQSPPSIELLPDLLAKVPVLLYSGDSSLAYNHVGVEKAISKLQFNGAVGLPDEAPARPWYVNETRIGSWRSARNLTYVLVEGAGFMVGYDQPLAMLNMVHRFIGVSPQQVLGVPARVEGEEKKNWQPLGGGEADGAAGNMDKEAHWIEDNYILFAGIAGVFAIGFIIFMIFRRQNRSSRGHFSRVKGTPNHYEDSNEMDELVIDTSDFLADDDDDANGEADGPKSPMLRRHGNGAAKF
ncbi:uncharacterized protein VTP21DRAFT_6817 [Calcarisporiella thermophila]|uniref:uncharacterized protein n=1 Tax=Calcarisporiella thermophila TaxID=911321 RepID=UPI0037431FF9